MGDAGEGPARTVCLSVCLKVALGVHVASRRRAIDAAQSHCLSDVALAWQELSNWSEKIVLNMLPRHQILRNGGCAAGVNN